MEARSLVLCQELDSSWVLGVSIVKGSCEGKGFQWWTGQRFRWERKAQTGQKMREVYDCQEVDKYKTGGKVQLLRDTYTWYCTAYGKQSPNKDVIENGPEAHRRYYVTLHHTRMVWRRRHRGSMWVIIEHSGRVWVMVQGKRKGSESMKSNTFFSAIMTNMKSGELKRTNHNHALWYSTNHTTTRTPRPSNLGSPTPSSWCSSTRILQGLAFKTFLYAAALSGDWDEILLW